MGVLPPFVREGPWTISTCCRPQSVPHSLARAVMSHPSSRNEAHYSQRGARVPGGMAGTKYVRVLSEMSSQSRSRKFQRLLPTSLWRKVEVWTQHSEKEVGVLMPTSRAVEPPRRGELPAASLAGQACSERPSGCSAGSRCAPGPQAGRSATM